MDNLRDRLEKINIEGFIAFDEPMSLHTTFGIGGKADIFVRPSTPADVAAVLKAAKGLPLFILGGGANILVSDKGIRGVTLDMSAITGCSVEGDILRSLAGTAMNAAAEFALEKNLSGLEFIYGMPGSVGGSVWMNARCYGTSVSDVLESVEVIGSDGIMRREPVDLRLFDYKKSPYQSGGAIITAASFRLRPGTHEAIRDAMTSNREDRKAKGHLLAPCAGSVFKNNRTFGEPTGKIIDTLGLRGFSIGGASIAPFHANIFINTGNASAQDVRRLVAYVQEEVLKRRGFRLEPEILFVGEWEET